MPASARAGLNAEMCPEPRRPSWTAGLLSFHGAEARTALTDIASATTHPMNVQPLDFNVVQNA